MMMIGVWYCVVLLHPRPLVISGSSCNSSSMEKMIILGHIPGLWRQGRGVGGQRKTMTGRAD